MLTCQDLSIYKKILGEPNPERSVNLDIKIGYNFAKQVEYAKLDFICRVNGEAPKDYDSWFHQFLQILLIGILCIFVAFCCGKISIYVYKNKLRQRSQQIYAGDQFANGLIAEIDQNRARSEMLQPAANDRFRPSDLNNNIIHPMINVNNM